MATSLTTLIQRVRRQVRDRPAIDAVTASVSSGATAISVVTDGTQRYHPQERLELDYETMIATAVAATSVTVMRGQEGTSAVSHSSGSVVLIDPRFSTQEIVDVLNEGFDVGWPYLYREVEDLTLAPTGSAYEFAIPDVEVAGSNGLGIVQPIPRISKVEVKLSGATEYVRVNRWTITLGPDPKLKLGYAIDSSATVRVTGYAPFAHLSVTDSLPVNFPYHAEPVLVKWAVGELLAAGEAGRVRSDATSIDRREEANRVGASMSISRDRRAVFAGMLAAISLPPMQPHLELTKSL